MLALHVTNRTPRYLTGNNKERYPPENANIQQETFLQSLIMVDKEE
jgi:hypothetical protein